jgi:uncharacterized protein YjiS (DUF1127 family)
MAVADWEPNRYVLLPRLRERLPPMLRAPFDWWRKRATVVELTTYPDYLLRDVGLARSEVKSAVEGRLKRDRGGGS